MRERRSNQCGFRMLELDNAERGGQRDEHGRHSRSEERVTPNHRLEAPLRFHQVKPGYEEIMSIQVTVIRRATTTRFSKF